MESDYLGSRLKKIREEKQYTLKQLSDLSVLSIGFISQVEREQADPSLASVSYTHLAFPGYDRRESADIRQFLLVFYSKIAWLMSIF